MEEQNRLVEKERDALNRQEALRAREQAEYQRKLDALELKSRKGSKWNPMRWFGDKYKPR